MPTPTLRLTAVSTTCALLPLLLSAPPAHAHSLSELLRTAQQYDASYQGAQQQYQASLAQIDQASALLRPTVGLSAGISHNTNDINPTSGDAEFAYNNQTVGVSLTQPLFNRANSASYAQAQAQLSAAQAQLSAARQDLIVRLSQAYFDALASSDSLSFVQAQKKAVAEQLAAAQRNFEVGTATITDSKAAQSRYDLVLAQEIAATNDLQIKLLALRQLTGMSDAQPDPVSTIPADSAADMQSWVDKAMAQHPALQQLQVAEQVAQLEVDKARAGHLPTVNLNASYGINQNVDGASSSSFYGTTVTARGSSVGVSLTIPLYAGNAIQNKVRQSLALQDKAHSDLLAAQRSIAQGVRTAYLGLTSGQAQVKAYEAARDSSQSALQASELGYQVGVGTNMDVLNAQSQLYSTQASLAQSRYSVLMTQIRLKQAAGVLTEVDVSGVAGQ